MGSGGWGTGITGQVDKASPRQRQPIRVKGHQGTRKQSSKHKVTKRYRRDGVLAPEHKHSSDTYSSNIVAKYAAGMVLERVAHMPNQFNTESTYSVAILSLFSFIFLLLPDLASCIHCLMWNFAGSLQRVYYSFQIWSAHLYYSDAFRISLPHVCGSSVFS